MKTNCLKPLMTALLITVLFSCGDDDDNKNNTASAIVGSWEVQSRESFECTVATDNKLQSCGQFSFCYTIVFNADQTFSMERTFDNFYLGAGTYGVAPNRLDLDFDSDPAGFGDTIGAELSINGATMVITEMESTCRVKMTFEKL